MTSRILTACVLTLASSSPLRALEAAPGLTVPSGFSIEIVAHIAGARELSSAPNGDLFVGTQSPNVMIVPNAEGNPGQPKLFARLPDTPAAGVAFANGYLYVGTSGGVWRIKYADDKREGEPAKIATVRPKGGGGHVTTSVAVSRDRLYASVGSSCDACNETDPTRASIQEMDLEGRGMHARAVHIRNAIALAVNPETGNVWAGDAGQDTLEHGHPYEIFDPFTLLHAGTPNYGWPGCYENHRSVSGAHNCGEMTVPRVVFPAYITPIGAVFYPTAMSGKFAFPAEYRGGAFVALHGSWHRPLVAPRVAFVPIKGDEPAKPVDWSNPDTQWRQFVGGFQRLDQSRIGRPTGITVGPEGSLFVADDYAGLVYRIRPKPQ